MNFAERYGPWALVVGSSAGIGAGAADEAASRGVNVVLVARRGDLLEQRSAEIRDRHGVETRALTVDLATPDAAMRVLTGVADLEIGLMVYNAAAEPRGFFLELPLDEHLTNIDVNIVVPTALVHTLATDGGAGPRWDRARWFARPVPGRQGVQLVLRSQGLRVDPRGRAVGGARRVGCRRVLLRGRRHGNGELSRAATRHAGPRGARRRAPAQPR